MTDEDVPAAWFFDIVRYFQNQVIAGVIAYEVGEKADHLHLNDILKAVIRLSKANWIRLKRLLRIR